MSVVYIFRTMLYRVKITLEGKKCERDMRLKRDISFSLKEHPLDLVFLTSVMFGVIYLLS